MARSKAFGPIKYQFEGSVVNYNGGCKRQHLLKISPFERADSGVRLVNQRQSGKNLTARFFRVTIGAAGPRIPL